MSFPSPLLHIPTRTTADVDFSGPFTEYIQLAFEQDGSKFRNEISILNRLRQDMRGAGKDLTGRDILYRYYGQLELLDLRFPFDESHVHMSFSWNDSFTGEECSQYSIAFEKASVIYNLGATCSSIAALQNRFEAEGLRIAFNYFQAAAGLFSFINENFLHAPSVDMSRDSIKTLTELALAQAQECFLEKVTVVEKKKGNLASKLCAQLSFMYMTVLDGFSLESISRQFEKTWLELIRIKAKLFASLAHYHRHLQYEMDNQYGLSVSHIMVAETNIKEANKLAEKFAYNFPNFNISSQSNETNTTGKAPSSASIALLEVTKMDLKMISDKLAIAKRDNDMIYHDAIPPVDSLTPLEKLNAVKAIPFADLLPNGQADIPKIVGTDIFAKLIPMSVHESSSVYSEEKSKLYRSQQKLVTQADDEIEATLNSLNLRETMERIKEFYRNSNNISGDLLLPEVMEWSVRVQENEMKSSKYLTKDLVGIINSLKPSIEEMLSEIPLMLDKEQLDCENMRVKYMNSWTQEPSATVNATMRSELRAHKESYEKAVPLDNPIIKELEESKNIIDILNRPVDSLETYLVDIIVSAIPFDEKNSLLDENASKEESKIGLLGEQISIEKIDSLIQHLRSLKSDRATILEEMKEKIKKDDISSLLLLNKSKEKQIFQSELTKYAHLQTKINSNLDSHKQFLGDLVSEFKKLAISSKALSINEARNQEKMKIFQDWRIQYQRYKVAKDGLRKGRVFYTDLKSSLDELKSKVIKFVNQRSAERVTLEKKIEVEFAESGQRAIKEQLQRLSVDSTTVSGGIVSPYFQPGAPHHVSANEVSAFQVSQHNSYHNDISQLQRQDFHHPSAPVVSPHSLQTSLSQNSDNQGSRTPIPPLRGSRNSFSRDSGGLEIDHSPTSNSVATYPRATFDAQQFHALASKQQPFDNSSSQSYSGHQGGFRPISTMYAPEQQNMLGQRSNSLPKQTVTPHILNSQSSDHPKNYANREYYASMPIRGQVYRPEEQINSQQVQGFPQQPNIGMGQFYRPGQNIPATQEHRPLHGYVPPQGYIPQQTGYQPSPRATLPQAYPPTHGATHQGYQPQEYRPIRNDMYSSRPGLMPQAGTVSPLSQGHRPPNHPPTSNRPYGGGFVEQSSGMEYQSNRPSSQAYMSHQRPDAATIYNPQSQGFSVNPSNQGYGYPLNASRPPGYVRHEGPTMYDYRPLNAMHAQHPNQRPPGGGQQGPTNTQANQYAQYNPAYQNPPYTGPNNGASLMD